MWYACLLRVLDERTTQRATSEVFVHVHARCCVYPSPSVLFSNGPKQHVDVRQSSRAGSAKHTIKLHRAPGIRLWTYSNVSL